MVKGYRRTVNIRWTKEVPCGLGCQYDSHWLSSLLFFELTLRNFVLKNYVKATLSSQSVEEGVNADLKKMIHAGEWLSGH